MTNALASRMARAAVPLAEALAALPLARYEIVLRAEADAHLPRFTGALLRGAFGFALKRAVCAMPHGDCARCMLESRCVYPQFYETRWQPNAAGQSHDAPHPFVLHAPVLKKNADCGLQNADSAEPIADSGTLPSAISNPQLQKGDSLTFTLALLGRAHEALPYVVYAFDELARRGLTARRHPFTLAAVNALAPDGERHTVYTHETQQLTAFNAPPLTLNDYVTARTNQLISDCGLQNADSGEAVTPSPRHPVAPSLRLRFLTPTRFKVAGQLQWRTDFGLLARNLVRRVTLAVRAHGSPDVWLDVAALLARVAEVRSYDEYLRWWDFGRYSTRQQTEMKLGGFVGNVGFRGDALPDFLPLIAAGEVLGVGSATTFGLGQYRVRAYAAEDAARTYAPAPLGAECL